MKRQATYYCILLVFFTFELKTALGQNSTVVSTSGQRNVITSAVPFLSITPDSRSGAMGDVGVAIPPDANTIHWNPSKLAFLKRDFGIGLSYTPWLKALVPDINLSYLSGYYNIDDLSAFGASLRYFSLGDIQFTNKFGQYIKDFRPYEFSIDAAYARKLSDEFSVGLALRYIYSNLAGSIDLGGGLETSPGEAISGDISFYWNKPVNVFGKDADFALGGNISNLGSKITYTDETQRDFIPMNFRIGTYLNLHLDEYNELGFSLDLNKLLVPTPPIYDTVADIPVIKGMIQSFYDAPGGFKEEMREINPSIGIEYWYDKQFAFRTGYFYEHPTKGNRQYMTIGAGIRYNVIGMDVAYLVPTNNTPAGTTSPLEKTLRISLTLDIVKGKDNKDQ